MIGRKFQSAEKKQLAILLKCTVVGIALVNISLDWIWKKSVALVSQECQPKMVTL